MQGRLKTHLKGDDNHICLLGGCLLITYVPLSPKLSVKTPLYKLTVQLQDMGGIRQQITRTHVVFNFKIGIPEAIQQVL